MRLLRLACEDTRNLQAVTVEPGPRFNLFEGANGQGKTNLLEAVGLVATLRSIRDAPPRDLIRWGQPQARVLGAFERGGVRRELELEISPKGRRARLDGHPVRRLSESAGHLVVVPFGPDDLSVTKASPAVRRRFLDRAVFEVWAQYADEARAYVRALKSRNQLLRTGSSADPTVLESFDIELARRGARVLWRRVLFVASLRPLFQAALRDMTGGGLEGDLRYRGAPGVEEGQQEEALRGALRQALQASGDRDRRRGFTSVGPHTDEVVFELQGRSVRRFASQGQHRAFVLALKIAELGRVEAELGAFPLLLLDDVSSELDRERNRRLMDYLDTAGGQVFITTTDRRWIQVDGATNIFQVDGGQVRRVEG